MRLLGKLTQGATAFELVADRKRTTRFEVVEETIRVAKLSVYVDGLGSGSETQQVMRGVIYDGTTAKLMGYTSEVAVLDGQAGGWVDLPFTTLGGIELPPGLYDFGVHVGGIANIIRFYGDDPSGWGSMFNTDTYADGPASTYGSPSTVTADLSIFGTYFIEWEPPEETDDYYGRLPHPEAQAELGEETPAPNPKFLASVGWHHTHLDPEWGAFAIVNEDGPLADLLGERVKVTVRSATKERSVVAYVHNRGQVEDDLSLTRRLFFGLAQLSEDNIKATVEVLL